MMDDRGSDMSRDRDGTCGVAREGEARGSHCVIPLCAMSRESVDCLMTGNVVDIVVVVVGKLDDR